MLGMGESPDLLLFDETMSRFQAGLSGVSFTSEGCRLLGGFYKAAGDTLRPTAMLLHGLPGIEKHLDIAYALRDLGWNCLYFHFRGCWGSHGAYDLAGLANDMRAATDWVAQQPEVDPERIVVIGASTGSHPALVCGAADPRIRAIVGISPVIEPGAFQFPPEMAAEFAAMLHGVTGPDLVDQWNALPSLTPALSAFSPRPVLLVASEQDDIFPPSQYAAVVAPFANLQLVTHPDADHSFSAYRPWLVHTVTDWLLNRPAR
jgi:alpha/beta superfamily hydrolase